MTPAMAVTADPTDRSKTTLSVVSPEEKQGCTQTGVTPCSEVIGTGDLARACQTTVRTIRFYEETGLIEPLDRKDGCQRYFRKGTEQRLRLIMDLREAGLSLQEIKDLFAIKAGSKTATEAAQTMAAALEKQAEALQEKIAILRRLRDDLAATTAVLAECEPCNEERFPERCPSCDVMTRPDLPRAMKLLWGPPDR
jgi:DNA-binding transcriptional MerR regulator